MIEEQPNDDAAVHLPAEVLGAMFKTTPDAFRNIAKNKEHVVVIARKPGFGRTNGGKHGD